MTGYRFIKDAGGTGITIDAFIGIGIGYRDFQRDYPPLEDFEKIFQRPGYRQVKYSLQVRGEHRIYAGSKIMAKFVHLL